MRKISQVLKEERESQNLNLHEVEKGTKIKKQFLQAIEEGKFHQLPSESYALGFVKNYATFLGIDSAETVPLFRREYKAEVLDEVVPHYTKNQPKKKSFIFSYKGLVALLGFLIVAGYIVFQFQSLFVGPKLTIISPKNGQTFSKNVVEVRGSTDQYATVMVDGEEAYVGIDGTFRKSLYIFSGEKKIKVVAKDRRGKQVQQEIQVIIR